MSKKRILVTSVRTYPNKKNGKLMVAINGTQVHTPFSNLAGLGIENPWLLVGHSVTVDFFDVGEKLLNGEVVTTDGIIMRDIEFSRDIIRDQFDATLRQYQPAAAPVAAVRTAQPAAAQADALPPAIQPAANEPAPAELGDEQPEEVLDEQLPGGANETPF